MFQPPNNKNELTFTDNNKVTRPQDNLNVTHSGQVSRPNLTVSQIERQIALREQPQGFNINQFLQDYSNHLLIGGIALMAIFIIK